MRIACLMIPNLPLRAELRAHPHLMGTPIVLASGSEGRAEVVAASPEATALGVRPPCSVAHARSVCAEISVRLASPALDEAARQALRDIALSFSPRVAPAPRAQGIFACEGAVFLDASGVASLFHSEAGFAASLAARAQALGLPGVVAIASSRSVAQLVARQLTLPRSAGGHGAYDGECCVLGPEEEARALAPLPIDLLSPGDELAQTLTRFGVQTVRDLLRLPRSALAKRLGPEVLRLIDKARGKERELPLPEPRNLELREAIDLDHPIHTREPLAFVLRGLLSRLTERLAVRGLACDGLDMALELSEGARDHRRIGLGAPTCDVRVLLRLTLQAFEQHPPDAPIESLCVSTEGRPARRDQLDLFRTAGPDPNSLDRALAKLESLCGAERVGAPAVVDDHHPNAFALQPFSSTTAAPRSALQRRLTRAEKRADTSTCGDESRPPSKPPPHACALAVRALRPPVRAEVRTHRGRPVSLRSAVACGRVLEAAGPWRTTGRWWSEQERFALDHFDVHVSDGTILRLCFDWVRRDWQIDAIYD